MTTIHLIAHTHWDREWYLTFQQFRVKLVALIDHLLNILDENPSFSSFLLDGQAIILEDYLQIRPDRKADLICHIQNGRLFIGPWYISPDEFLISPEAHIRNLLEGDRLCRLFGGKMAVGYLPDTFGHIGQMPQLLNGFGIDTACLWRGLDDQSCELEWIAPDGSRVLLAYIRDSYSNAASLIPDEPDKFTQQIHELSNSLIPYIASDQVLLMNGTDHMEPSEKITEAIAIYQQNIKEDNLSISNLPRYFSSVRSHLFASGYQIPVVNGELRSSKRSAILPNVLSTRISLKQRNHACETLLLKWVEPLNAWAKLISSGATPNGNQPDNSETTTEHDSLIRYAWKLLMQCHPHDSICGTSVDQVVNEMNIRFDQVDQLGEALKSISMKAITDAIDTQGLIQSDLSDRREFLSCIVAFNPTDNLQTSLIQQKVKLDGNYSSFAIIDAEGKPVPFDQSGTGARELISMKLDKKSMKQAIGMIHEGNIAGMFVRDFKIVKEQSQVVITATMSEHAPVDMEKWRRGYAEMEKLFADDEVKIFIVHAKADPENEITFVAKDTPPNGYKSYWITGIVDKEKVVDEPTPLNPVIQRLLPIMSSLMQSPVISKLFQPDRRSTRKSHHNIENEFFIIEAVPGSTGISVRDKRSDISLSGLNQLIDGGDSGDLYNYCPPDKDSTNIAKIYATLVKEYKSYRQLIITYKIYIPSSLANDRKSRSHQLIEHTITSTVTLIPGVARIDIHTEIDNQSADHRLRVHFPSPIKTSFAYHDGHFEIVKRPVDIPKYDDSWEEPPRPEVPQCQFSAIADGSMSLMVANRGLPEVEAITDENGATGLALTLLRCVGWLSRDDLITRKGHAGPMDIGTPGAQMIGKHSFDYAIIPGDADWRNSIMLANTFNAPLQATVTSLHAGTIPVKYSVVENSNHDFFITTIKLAEAKSGLILRGYNTRDTPIETTLIPMDGLKKAYLLRLDEQPLEELALTKDSNLILSVAGNKIVTILFTP
jgi:mannosylglycerate hydrolase